MHNTLAFLYTNNEKSEREIKESIPFTIATKRIKYLGINLPETKELYTENYDTDERNQRQYKQMERYTCSCVGRINTVKMTILPNAIYRFNVILSNYQWHFFTEVEQKISQFIWKHKTPNSQSSLEKEEWSWKEESTSLASDYTTKL